MLKFIAPFLLLLNPEFYIYDRIRPIEQTDILSDVRSHLSDDYYMVSRKDYPTNSIISNDSMLITSVHECTHGVNSFLRNEYSTKDVKINGFYCLDNRFITIRESHLTLTDVAKSIPKSIRFNAYDLTFKGNLLRDWNDRCLYLMDEHIAHTTSCMYRKQKKIRERPDAVKLMFEYGFYSLVHLQMLKGSSYEDYDKLKWFLEWNFNRCFDTFDGEEGAKVNMKIFLESEDCKDLRGFIIDEFGAEFFNRLEKIGNFG
jgi:hypothetical protein